MRQYRRCLPQLEDRLFLTDGELESSLSLATSEAGVGSEDQAISHLYSSEFVISGKGGRSGPALLRPARPATSAVGASLIA